MSGISGLVGELETRVYIYVDGRVGVYMGRRSPSMHEGMVQVKGRIDPGRLGVAMSALVVMLYTKGHFHPLGWIVKGHLELGFSSSQS